MAFRQTASRFSSPYVQFLIVLGLTVLIVASVMIASGCGSCCGSGVSFNGSIQGVVQSMSGDFYVSATGTASVPPGGKVTRILRFEQATSEVDVHWLPPQGVTNVTFPTGYTPQKVGNTYIFENVPTDVLFEVGYDAPSDSADVLLTDDFVATSRAGETGILVYADVKDPETSRAEAPGAAGRQSLTAGPTPAPGATVRGWAMNQWYDFEGITLTTELCQDFLSALAGDAFFLAVRTPVTPSVGGSIAYRPAFVMRDGKAPTVMLKDYHLGTPLPMETVVTATLGYRPERAAAVREMLPPAAGQDWVTLGVAAGEPVSCPIGMDVAPGGWGVRVDYYLDLHDYPDNGEGEVLTSYACYEGQGNPFGFLGTQMLQRVSGVSATSEAGITCFGPKPAILTSNDAGRLELFGTFGAVVTPTATIEVMEELWNRSGSTLTATLSVSSTLGSDWEILRGEYDGPTGDPLGPDAVVEVGPYFFEYLWFRTTVPAGAAAGVHTMAITATGASEAVSAYDTVPLWVGAWVPPSGGAGGAYMTYIPVALRSQ